MSTLLFIGNTDITWTIVESSLLDNDMQVVEAQTLGKALPLLLSNKPDLLLADTHAQPVNGFQIARFFRSHLDLRRIPILLLSVEADPKTEFWSKESGADGILFLDPENLEALPNMISSLLSRYSSSNFTEEKSTGFPGLISAQFDSPKENMLLSSLFDINEDHLFNLSMYNRLRRVGGEMESLEKTVDEILNILQYVADTHISVLILKYGRERKIFIHPSREINRGDAEHFTGLCLEDFNRLPDAQTIRKSEKTYLNVDGREDFDRTRIDGRRVSSYHMAVLSSSDEDLIGTLHAGSLTNNYFTGRVGYMFDGFAEAASMLIHNTVLFNRTLEKQNKIEHIFSKFVPREVINDLLDQTEDAELQLGEKRHVAIIFSDIRSFTVISEHNSAEMIVDFLNRYFDKMSQAIRRHGGFIDKFIGDAILAVFGAPVSYEDNAERAVRASLDMKKALSEIETGDLVLPESGFNIGIGVHEGSTIVGNLGSRDKFDYTVIGDNVNLASRLEGLTKHYHEQIIVSDILASSLEGEFILREVDTVRVKGKEKPTTLYAVRSEPYFEEENLRNYQKGLSMFKLGNWITGKEYFEKILEKHPDDFLSNLYCDRCIEFAENPPEDWDGAIKLDFK